MKTKFSIFKAFVLFSLLAPVFQPRAQNSYEVIENAFGFGINIPGCADASKNIREIAIDELNIDVREMTTGLDVEYRLYGPGAAHWGNATFTSAVTLGGSKELQAWFSEASKGKNIRKNITVTLFKSDKTPGRTYVLKDCFPVRWSSVDFDPQFRGSTETLTVNIGRIEFKTASSGGGGGEIDPNDASPDDYGAPVTGFNVAVRGSYGKEVDTAWESVNGGELIIEMTETTIGSDKFRTTSPGHKTVSEIVLRGAMTDGRKSLCTWINDTVNGKPWKQMLTITEMLSVDGGVKDGKQYIYHDCFPIRYVFPRMSVSNTTGNVQEEVAFHTIRVERDLPRRAKTRLTIPGAPVASGRTLLVGVSDMNMDVNLIPKTGDARNHSARLVLPAGSSFELLKWMEARDLRDIVVEFIAGKKRVIGSLVMVGSYPVEIKPSAAGGVLMEEVTVKPIRVELK